MVQDHDMVGLTPSGFGLLGIVERDQTAVMCHECGRWLGGLSWHVTKVHEMTVAEYRKAHQLPAGVPLVSIGTSETISQQSRERVGSPGWQRFERRRDEVLPESQRLAAEASVNATAGTKAQRARAAAERFGGRGDQRRDEARWDERLAAYVEIWRRDGRAPRQRADDPEERSLALWVSHQWSDLYAGRLSERRMAALRSAGIPTERDAARGRLWRNHPPPES